MTLDQYSICPCGSGKKVKFCKCAEHLSEMAKIDRMVDGDQSVAALDKINQLLKAFPNEAWLYAYKCEIQLKLRELEGLEETSAKFIRLQPDNPLAKLFRSMVALLRGNVEESATLLVQSIADSGEVLHPLYLTVHLNLIQAMSRLSLSMPALMHTDILAGCTADNPDLAVRMHENILTQEDVSVLVREMPPSITEPQDAPWLERFREAYGLISSFQIQAAKTKLESIQREYGAEPEILLALLHCRLLLADRDGAARLAGKLAACSKLRQESRVYFQALEYEIDPAGSGCMIEDAVTAYELASDSDLDTKMLGSSMLSAIQDDAMRQMVMQAAKEEIAPKLICNYSIPILESTQFADLDLRLASGWVALFGRQTDRPPKLVFLESSDGIRQQATQRVLSELGVDSNSRQVLTTVRSPLFLQYDPPIVSKKQAVPEQQQAMIQAFRGFKEDNFLDTPLAILGGRSPRQCKDDPALAIQLQALVLYWQSQGSAGFSRTHFESLLTKLGQPVLRMDSREDLFDLVGGASYFWTDLDTIDAKSLVQMMQSAMIRRVHGVFPELIARAKTMEWPDDLKPVAEMLRLNLEITTNRNPDEVLPMLDQLIAICKSSDEPAGNHILEKVRLLEAMGRTQEAQSTFRQALQDHPRDPYLLQYIAMIQQYMQSQAAAQGPSLDNAIAMHGRAQQTSPASGGLWTPGTPKAPAATEPPREEKGSGLWLPGQ
jgi:tetratricopeptide (TPR) repeat protein